MLSDVWVLRKHPFRLCPPILLEHSPLLQRVLKDTEMMRSKMYFVPVMLLTKSVWKKEAQASLSKSGSKILNEQQVLVARPQFFYRSGWDKAVFVHTSDVKAGIKATKAGLV